jgi:hypothetical protein
MLKLFGGTFLALFVCAHLADLRGDAYTRPLSMFRDYDPAWIGYALFGLLIAIGLETARTAFRLRSEIHTFMYLLMTGLLAFVAATPSTGEWHQICAIVAMAIMFVYYAVLLYHGDELFWLVMHLLSPSFALMASHYESYGVFQKGMIVYFLVATIVHQGVLAQWLPKRTKKDRSARQANVRSQNSKPRAFMTQVIFRD